MPYVRREDREYLDTGGPPDEPGELTYELTKMWLAYLPSKPKFEDFVQIFGSTILGLLELYRRSIASYEDAKREENGDIPYPYAR